MSAVIACPTCRTPLVAAPHLAGQAVACPNCRQTIQLIAPERPLPRATPLPASQAPPTTGAAPAAPAGNRRKAKFPLGAVLSWTAMLACVIVPTVILWQLRARHLAQNNKAVAAPAAAKPQETPVVGVVTVAPSPGPALKTSIPASRHPASTSAAARPTLPGQAFPGQAFPGQVPPDQSLAPPTTVAVSSTPTLVGSAQTSSTPSPPPADILATLEAAWQLPALISTARELLGTLAAPPTEPLKVSVRYQAANIPAAAAIYADNSNEPSVWSLLYVPDLQIAARKVPLGTLRLEGARLSFAWNSVNQEGEASQEVELCRQLANCRLELQHGSSQRTVQLRAPLEQAACDLDLQQDVQKLEFQVPDLPRAELLRLEIAALERFPGGAQVKNSSLALGKETKIEFTEPAGAEIEVRFRQLSGGQLAVQLEPAFKEGNARTFDMTLPRLEAMEAGVTKALRTAEQELPIKQQQLKAQKSALSKLQGSPPKNPLLVPAWQQGVKSAESQVKRTASRVTSLQKQIPVHKARLAAVPGTRSFLTALDRQAEIRLRIVAQCDDGELELVRAFGPSAK